MAKSHVVTKAVIPAAGLGTRFLPATKATPKEMLPIIDKPAVQYLVEEAVASGIKDILFITGKGKAAIEDHFDRSFELNEVLKAKRLHEQLKELERIENLADIHYVRQKEPLGLGHAVLCAKKHVGNEPFAVLLGDDLVLGGKPCIGELVKVFEKHNSSVVGVSTVPKKMIPRYGIIKFKKAGNELVVEDLVEKPSLKEAPSNLAVLGRYVLKPEIFGILEQLPFGKGKELQLTDALHVLNGFDQILAHRIEGNWLTIGDKMTYLQAIVEFAMHRPELRKEFRQIIKGALK